MTTDTPFPINIAAYYPWYDAAKWQEGSDYTPALGRYTTASPEVYGSWNVVQWHIAMAKYARINAFMSSWWGPDHVTNVNLGVLLDTITAEDSPYPDLKVAALYELESVGDPSTEGILTHLEYLEDMFFSSPAYLHVEGKPVLFVFSGASGPWVSTRWAEAVKLYGKPLHLTLQLYGGYRTDPNQPTQWWQYNPKLRTDYSASPDTISVSASFDKPRAQPYLKRDATLFDKAVVNALKTPAKWRVFYFNEFMEGSQLEPTVGDLPNSAFLDVLARRLPRPS